MWGLSNVNYCAQMKRPTGAYLTPYTHIFVIELRPALGLLDLSRVCTQCVIIFVNHSAPYHHLKVQTDVKTQYDAHDLTKNWRATT